ncbi:MAG: SDR family oxidoreductase [Alphaproteobacteria bacterium]|nr:SDR family oxidoreductase [Alphaproteobacteria bacterium]
MHPSINGRVVVMTGGGRGLGRAMALGLVAEGAKVAITAAREGAELEETAADCRRLGGTDCVLALQADVTRVADCERVLREANAKWGKVHVVVNNAGRGMTYVHANFVKARPNFWEMPTDTVRMIIETNVMGPFNMAKAAVPYLLDAGWGRIVNVSTSLITMQRKGFWPYGTSKWAVEGATVIMAQDLEDSPITVNTLLPGGATNTKMIPGDLNDKTRTGADGNLFEPEIMVPPIQYLVSDLSNGKRGDRYVAKLWDKTLPPEDAATKARFPCRRNRTY